MLSKPATISCTEKLTENNCSPIFFGITTNSESGEASFKLETRFKKGLRPYPDKSVVSLYESP